MNRRMLTTFGAALLLVAVAVGGVVMSTPDDAEAQVATPRYEYAYLRAVERLEGYEIDLDRWAGPKDGKTYLTEHLFVYEEGRSNFDRQYNSLKKINELAEEGWELVDASEGLLRRAR